MKTLNKSHKYEVILGDFTKEDENKKKIGNDGDCG